jgi:lipoprotein
MKKKLFTLFLLSFLMSSLSGCRASKENQTLSAAQESESISTQEHSKEEKTTASSESDLTQASVDDELSLSESIYFPYENLNELTINKHTDKDSLKNIISKLPEIAKYIQLSDVELSNDSSTITIKYDEIYDGAITSRLYDTTITPPGLDENPLYSSPYIFPRLDNNALLLIIANDSISYVNYEISVPTEFLVSKPLTLELTRENFTKHLGDISNAKGDKNRYCILLDYDNAVFANKIHINGVVLGAKEDMLIKRYKEPAEKDGNNYTYFTDNSIITFRLEKEKPEDNLLTVTKISVRPLEKISYLDFIPYNVGLIPDQNGVLSKSRVEGYLGEPRKKNSNTDYYRLTSGLSDYLYFVYDDNENVIEHGMIREGIVPKNN